MGSFLSDKREGRKDKRFFPTRKHGTLEQPLQQPGLSLKFVVDSCFNESGIICGSCGLLPNIFNHVKSTKLRKVIRKDIKKPSLSILLHPIPF